MQIEGIMLLIDAAETAESVSQSVTYVLANVLLSLL